MTGQVIYQSVFYNHSGYAAESRGLVKELVRRGFTVKISPLGKDPPDQTAGAEFARLKELEATPADLGRSLFILAHSPLGVRRPPGSPCAVLRSMYETERIHPEWVENCDRFDEVWVPSTQSQEAFIASGLPAEKVKLVPGGVDTDQYRPDVPPYPLVQRKEYAFLSVFNWQWRKGWDLLVAAYCEAFGPNDPVTLYLKVDHSAGRPFMLSEFSYFVTHVLKKRLHEIPDIVLLDQPFTEQEMAALYNAVDCFVLPTRGEGYNRPFLEAMACALPVIGTAWGGQSDFLTDETGYPLSITGLAPVPEYEREWFRGLRWAAPDPVELGRLMRHLYTNGAEGRRKGEVARRRVREGWDYRQAGEVMANAIHRILDERGLGSGDLGG